MRFQRTITTFVFVAGALISVLLLAQSKAGAGGPAGVADPIRGGLLWDRWWVVIDVDPPPGDHPLYPPEGQQSGSSTFRCKECHGWDYKGADGAYGQGSHFTGIPGVYGSTLTPQEMFDLIKFDAQTVPNGHGFGGYGLSDGDIDDLVDFLQTLVIDTDTYIDQANGFIGDELQGEFNYTEGGEISCILCHGPKGNNINFGSPEDPEWVGTIAVDNPWELLHKIRFGNPGAPMPSWLAGGGTDQGAADIGKYAQLNFPTGPCAADVTGDGNVNVEDLVEVIFSWGVCQ